VAAIQSITGELLRFGKTPKLISGEQRAQPHRWMHAAA